MPDISKEPLKNEVFKIIIGILTALSKRLYLLKTDLKMNFLSYFAMLKISLKSVHHKPIESTIHQPTWPQGVHDILSNMYYSTFYCGSYNI